MQAKSKVFMVFLLIVSFTLKGFAQTPEENLEKLKINLPPVSKPVASYVNVVRVGNLLYLSGKGPLKENGEYIKGKLGNEITIEQGYEAARLVAINQLAVLKAELQNLGKVKRIVKVNGFVNSTDNFYDQPKVMNGFSDLMVAVFGEKGRHARSAIGVNTLPMNIAVEVELVVEIE